MQLTVIVPIADLRREPCHLVPADFSHNPLRESQLLYGESLTLLKEQDEWLYVSANEQLRFSYDKGWHDYPGWVHQTEVAYEKKVTSQFTTNFSKKQLVLDAEKYFLGTPYLWGGKAHYSINPIGGVDCSSLIYMLYRKQGKIIPRDAHDQFLKSKIISKEELEPGDLLFWAPVDRPRRMTHVVLFKDKGHFIEAPYSGEKVRIQPLPLDFWEPKNHFHFLGRNPRYLVIPAQIID